MAPQTSDVRSSLESEKLLALWEQAYRDAQNIEFYRLALDYIFQQIHIPPGADVLDAGCGSGVKSLLLAERGCRVTAVDVSQTALRLASEKIRSLGMHENIVVVQEDLTALSFDEQTFDMILCWGVLMHVPEVERAFSELSRTLKPGGFLVISEGNMRSMQAFLTRTMKRALKRSGESIQRTPAGIENWSDGETGRYLTRQADPAWIDQQGKQHGLRLIERRAGELTEWYTRFRLPFIKYGIHRLNRFWFRWIRLPGVAFGNLFIFKKET